MTDWLRAAFEEPIALPWQTLALRLAVSLALGTVVARIYRATRRPAHVTPTFPATLVLLCVLIAMVTQVIGDNVARAFSLVGALSIVRFRTVVQDTKDTAFVIFAVIVGMAVGAGQHWVALCGMATAGLAAALYRDLPAIRGAVQGAMRLTVRIGLSPDTESLLLHALSRHATEVEPISAATVRQGTALKLSYHLRLEEGSLAQITADLKAIDGVQSVDFRRLNDA